MSIGFYNGEFIPIDEKVIPIQERGHQFGDGVYEVIRVYNGRPFMMKEHMQRLEHSTAAIQIVPAYSTEQLEAYIHEGLNKSGLQEAEVYIQITRGIAPRQHLFPECASATAMTIRPARDIPESLRLNGVSITLREDERWKNCYIKSLNLLPNILAKQAAHAEGYYEAVFERDGWITEGSSTNVFAVKNGVLFTPPATHKILHGITRLAVLQLAEQLNLQVNEEDLSKEFFQQADEVFITSTSIEVMPVISIDGSTVKDGKPGAVTRKLQEAYRKLYR